MPTAAQKASDKPTDAQKLRAAEDIFKQQQNKLRGFFRDTAKLYVEQEQKHDPYANDLLKEVQKAIRETLSDELKELAKRAVSQTKLYAECGDAVNETLRTCPRNVAS